MVNDIKAVLGKPFDRLTNKQKKLYDELVTRFINGDRLYGPTLDSTEHVGWAVGLCIALLQKDIVLGEENRTMFLEISIDDRGISVAKPVIDFIPAEDDVIL